MRFVNAKPVWFTDQYDVNTYALFKAGFDSDKGDTKLLIAADSHYAVYVNGIYIYAQQFADDEDRRVYDEIDISDCVKAGRNELVIGGYCTYTDSSVYKKASPYVIFEVFEGKESRAHSSSDTLACRDERYLSGETDLITGQLGYTFHMDLTPKRFVWKNAFETGANYLFEARPIHNCVMEDRKNSVLFTQGVFLEMKKGVKTVGQRMQNAMLAYREASELKTEDGGFASDEADGMYFVYDLGEEETGLMDIEIETDEDAEILLGWGEHLDDMRVRAYVGGRNFASVLKAKKGRNHFFHPYRRLGLRYLQLHVYARRVKIHYAGVRSVHYPVADTAGIGLSDALHQKIYDTCRRTLLLCMHEHYEDCPWREQALYGMDSRNQMLAGYYVFGEYDFAKSSIETLARSLRRDHMLELCAPGRVAVNIPSFSMMYVVALWEYLLYSGDRDFVLKMLPAAEEIAESAVSRIRSNGLAPRYSGVDKWNFYEWSENLDGSDSFFKAVGENRYDAPMNAFLVLCVNRLGLIYDSLGKKAEAERMLRISKELSKAVHTHFYNPQTGMYASFMDESGKLSCYDELTQSLCVYADICPSKEREKALKRLTDGSMTEVTIAYSIFKYEALLKKASVFGAWVRKDVERQWGGMLMRGATTFFETIKAGDDFDRAGSLCHGWSAVPAYLYFAYGAGLKPEKPGWQQMKVRHASGRPGVGWARIRYRNGNTETFS